MGDPKIAYDSDQDVSVHHSKLLEAVAQLDKGQRVKKAERSEPTLEVSEYHLVKSGQTNKDAVHVQDLAKSLGRKGYQNEITKKFRSAQSQQKKAKVLPKPMEEPAAQRIKRIVGYDNVKKELRKWDAIVAKNRSANHLFFPLNTPTKLLKISATTAFLQNYIGKTDLQKKLEELDPEKTKKPPEETKEKDNYQMTLEEVKLKRKEAARFRAQQSYKEAKAHRLRKVKSKKFHRILRKERVKEQLKEFEELQKTDPEKALAKLQQLDKSRAEERISLRHKSTGQWARNKQIRAKYDKETRQELAEQLAISRELTQKLKQVDDSDDENEENQSPLVLSSNDKENPWMNNMKTESEVDEFLKSCRKYYEKNPKSQKEEVAKVERKSESSVKECTLDDKLKKRKNSDESKKTDDAVSSANQKTRETIETKKVDKKAKTRCTIISDKIVSKKTNVKLCDKKKKAKKRDVSATSTRQVEELQCSRKTDSKTSKLEDIDDMFDSMEEKLKHKADLKLQKVKKKLKVTSKVKKQNKKDKENEDYSPNLEFKKTKQKPVLDLPLDETTSKKNVKQTTNLTNLKALANITEQEPTDKSNSHKAEIDPQKYLNIKPKHFKTQLPDLDVGEEDAMENVEREEETHRIMSEAFADDDVVEEFRKKKEEEIKNSQPENIDLRLPGWGNWAGPNIKKSKVKRKNKLLILNFPKDAPRKDENKGDVIIFEGSNEKLKEHLVSELPYPFTSVKDFEASIRAPVGRTFVPENAHKRLIQPAVNTKIGKVIKPMTEDVLVKQPTLKRRLDKNRGNAANNKKNNKKKRK